MGAYKNSFDTSASRGDLRKGMGSWDRRAIQLRNPGFPRCRGGAAVALQEQVRGCTCREEGKAGRFVKTNTGSAGETDGMS